MLARLEMKLEAETKLSYQMSSAFHGALMEQLSPEEAEILHTPKLHPYTQHLEFTPEKSLWVVTALHEDALEKIIYQKLLPLKEFTLKKQQIHIRITEKKLTEYADQSLAALLYSEKAPDYIQLHFLTPTAFKQNGEILFYPDIRGIYINLLNRYAAAAEKTEMKDEDTLEALCKGTKIVRYDLKSVPFPLEGIKISAFIGKITLKLSGTNTMRNFANMLFHFGEYSGVGMKTSLGMGAYRLLEKEEGNRDRKTN